MYNKCEDDNQIQVFIETNDFGSSIHIYKALFWNYRNILIDTRMVFPTFRLISNYLFTVIF